MPLASTNIQHSRCGTGSRYSSSALGEGRCAPFGSTRVRTPPEGAGLTEGPLEQGKISLADAARILVRRMDAGVLSTHSVEIEGYPFGSLTPFVASPEGRPVILVNSLTQHGRNISADPRVCLTVYDPAEKDKIASSRVSVMGNVLPLPEKEREALAERYFAFFPHSRKCKDNHVFQFYWIEPHRVRFASGFGRIHWLPKEGWLLPTPSWSAAEAALIGRVNDRLAGSLAEICRYFHQREASGALVVAVDPEGFHLRADDDILYFVFEKTCFTPDEIEGEISRMAGRSRG